MSEIAVQDKSTVIVLDAGYIDGVKHLHYHSRFDPEHYAICDECREANLDFLGEPEFAVEDGCED